MLVDLYIKNVEGIIDERINLISKARNKETSNSVYKTIDGTFINRQLAIIGANATGKTSTLKVLRNTVRYIIFPSIMDRILSAINNPKDIKDVENLKKGIYNFYKLNQNVDLEREDSKIYIELYIETAEEETTGYYDYYLDFSGDILEKGIDLEQLLFRKQYNSKKKEIISRRENIKNSQIGYNYAFLRNMNTDDFKEWKFIKAFGDELITRMKSIILEETDTDFLATFIKSNSEIAKKIINIVDSKITKIKTTSGKNDDINKYKFYTPKGNYLKYSQLSTGTQKLLFVVGSMIESIRDEQLILVDEIDSNINNRLIKIIFDTFHSKRNKSQLVFTTNYPGVIPEDFRYDQIYILSKKDGVTVAKRLIDIKDKNGKKVRQDVSFSRAYLNGKFDDISEIDNNKLMINDFLNCL